MILLRPCWGSGDQSKQRRYEFGNRISDMLSGCSPRLVVYNAVFVGMAVSKQHKSSCCIYTSNGFHDFLTFGISIFVLPCIVDSLHSDPSPLIPSFRFEWQIVYAYLAYLAYPPVISLPPCKGGILIFSSKKHLPIIFPFPARTTPVPVSEPDRLPL